MDAMLAGGGRVARGAYFASKSAAPELRDRPCSTLVCVRASVYIKGPGRPAGARSRNACFAFFASLPTVASRSAK
jgi:hypothetical protein